MPTPRLIEDELELLESLLPTPCRRAVELGCGAASTARALLRRHPGLEIVALEVDARQMAKNLAAPQERLHFVAGVAQSIPGADAAFDLALMLKSLHHVPVDAMAQALGEVARVLRPGGLLYVSEPVFDGPFNEVVRLFNDERVVRAAAQAALDAALRDGPWRAGPEVRFETPVEFADFAAFEQQLMHATYADHRIDPALRERVRSAFEAHGAGAGGGVRFVRPMHVRVLRRGPAA
ncbi:MAG: class I SAM-dependent methyltransferase [Burkholderiales bacterium]|nr:methyltransferase domain-containing protein [Burkholderiales bacterium]MDE1927194.1 class I SAM-dependent methyltransferase [Burkholderiales bacterium]MDE2157920.1 class I SAM-dependent methyltransferase [Burkholderiales bacterium]MDE2504477.1 class I SAM-dependent methyltransferase [Burkholderiales bacterium]